MTPNVVKYIVKTFELTTWTNNPFYMPPKPTINAVPVTVNEREETTEPINEFEVTQPFKKYKLIKKERVGNNARIFTFGFSNPKSVYSLPPSNFILVRL